MVKAYQVPWDIQDSMFESEDWYLENVAIFGNKDFIEYICPEVKEAKDVLEEVGHLVPYDEALTALLKITTGKEWECTIIRGCCQSDWNKLYYPKDISGSVEDIERRYFNTGSEWRIEEDGEYDVYHYTTAWDNDEIKSEIAEIACVPVEDVQMFEFNGYRQEATYNEI